MNHDILPLSSFTRGIKKLTAFKELICSYEFYADFQKKNHEQKRRKIALHFFGDYKIASSITFHFVNPIERLCQHLDDQKDWYKRVSNETRRKPH
jgi:hypothetical protein